MLAATVWAQQKIRLPCRWMPAAVSCNRLLLTMCQEQSHLSLGLPVKFQQSHITRRYTVLWPSLVLPSIVTHLSSVHKIQLIACCLLLHLMQGCSSRGQITITITCCRPCMACIVQKEVNCLQAHLSWTSLSQLHVVHSTIKRACFVSCHAFTWPPTTEHIGVCLD